MIIIIIFFFDWNKRRQNGMLIEYVIVFFFHRDTIEELCTQKIFCSITAVVITLMPWENLTIFTPNKQCSSIWFNQFSKNSIKKKIFFTEKKKKERSLFLCVLNFWMLFDMFRLIFQRLTDKSFALLLLLFCCFKRRKQKNDRVIIDYSSKCD